MIDMRKGTCPICQHYEILEVVPADFADANLEQEMAVTYEPRWVMPGRNPSHPYGPLRIYVCRGCGYAQWFASDPQAIPVGEQHKTRLIRGPRPGEDGPYR